MLKNQKNKNNSADLVSDPENYMQAFRENIGALRTYYGYSVRVLAEKADMSYDSLSSFLKSNSRDCNLSTAVKLARVFGISVDEIVGSGTIEPVTVESMQLTRDMAPNYAYMVRWHIRHLYKQYKRRLKYTGRKFVSLMIPEYIDSSMIATNDFAEDVEITEFSDSIKAKVFLGIRVTCDDYMPLYSPFDTILLANDREPLPNEYCVVIYFKRLCIVKKEIKDGKVIYKGLRNAYAIIPEEDIDRYMGYVAAVKHD